MARYPWSTSKITPIDDDIKRASMLEMEGGIHVLEHAYFLMKPCNQTRKTTMSKLSLPSKLLKKRGADHRD